MLCPYSDRRAKDLQGGGSPEVEPGPVLQDEGADQAVQAPVRLPSGRMSRSVTPARRSSEERETVRDGTPLLNPGQTTTPAQATGTDVDPEGALWTGFEPGPGDKAVDHDEEEEVRY